MSAPHMVVCPACNAQPGQPCTAPTINGRRDVKYFHNSRETIAADTPDLLDKLVEARIVLTMYDEEDPDYRADRMRNALAALLEEMSAWH